MFYLVWKQASKKRKVKCETIKRQMMNKSKNNKTLKLDVAEVVF